MVDPMGLLGQTRLLLYPLKECPNRCEGLVALLFARVALCSAFSAYHENKESLFEPQAT